MPNKTGIEQKEKGFVAHFFFWIAIGFVAVALYMLSTAPAQKLAYMNDKKGARIFMVVYAPVIWASNNVLFVNRFFGWYMKLWHVEE
jgi:hypothetical protein